MKLERCRASVIVSAGLADAGRSTSAAPQTPQKRPSNGFSRPHEAQIVTKRAYDGLNADAGDGRTATIA